MSEARARVIFGDATFEIEGTESFVSAQLQNFGAPIRAGMGLRDPDPVPVPPPPPIEMPPVAAGPDLTGVVALIDGSVRIVASDIPGDRHWARVGNVAMLLACGVERLQDRRVVTFEQVRAACKACGCYDRKNFATELKRHHRTVFVFGRTTKSRQHLALTEAGRKQAEMLIQSLRAPVSPDPGGRSPQ